MDVPDGFDGKQVGAFDPLNLRNHRVGARRQDQFIVRFLVFTAAGEVFDADGFLFTVDREGLVAGPGVDIVRRMQRLRRIEDQFFRLVHRLA